MTGNSRDDEGANGTPSGSAAPRSAAAPATGSAPSAGDDALSAVTLPTIATPRGGGAIRSIGETFRANAVTGTGSISVPLPLSPSRGGTGPKLGLGYDSGQGQGPFGVGWNVDIPSITRRTDKGLPQYRDAGESDEFVLSGAEVLVPALLPGSSARDERDEGNFHVARYRPRIEGAFARIEKRTDNLTGEVHWRTVTKDNVTSLFGRSAGARLADPIEPRRVFAWHLEVTFDDRGNVTWFRYKPEDAANVPLQHAEEKTRLAEGQSFANLYVKRVCYGNRAPLATSDPAPADLQGLGWLFQAVFDYGEHDQTAPTPDDASVWPCRQDPFSTFRSTFDVRTYRLCRRVLMFHEFEEELGPDPVLVRSLDLTYDESPVATTLRGITATGWIALAGGGYATASQPRLDLGYTPADLQTTVQAIDRASAVNVPGGVDGSRYRFVDLEGEGIPGVLSQQGGALFYTRNDGQGQLARAQPLRTKPNVAQLGAPTQSLASLAGDGRMDLMLLGSDMRGFFERTEEGGWSPFRSFSRVPNLDPGNPNLRFIDLDGDGLADAVVAEDEVFVWSRSLGKDGFERPQVVRKPSDEDVGPTFVFADATQSIFVADMTGDGLVDLVRVRNGEICYWPNLGYARFGAKITMGSAPRFDRPEAFDPRRLRFGDVDGSGTSDIAYVRPDGVALYLNQSGNRWSEPLVIAGIPGRRGTTIDLVDLLGTGTACLVWSSPEPVDGPRPIRFVDLLGGTKPHLLNRVTNNLGLETRTAYASSTSFSLQDRAAGTPWVTRLPFPVQVVARTETVDHVQGTRLVTTYRYKHGFYDGVERELRGFGRVEHVDAEFVSSAHGAGLFPPGANEVNGEFVLAPVRTVTWVDTGAWREARELFAQYRREWYSLDAVAPALGDPTLPGEMSDEEAREAARARKGALLRREIYADDGTPQAVHPYAVEEHRYNVVNVQRLANERHAVFFTHESETVGRHYERNPLDPRVEQSFTIDVDSFGNVLRAANVAYPRRVPAELEQGVLLATCARATFANPGADPASPFYRLGVPIEARVFELTGLVPPPSGLLTLADLEAATSTAAEIAFDATPAAGALQQRVIQHRRTLYLKDDLSGPLPLGGVESRALVFEAYGKSLTATLVATVFGDRVTPALLTGEAGYANLEGDSDYWRPSGRPAYAAARFYQATAMTDPFGNTSRVVLDQHALLATEMHSSDDPAFDNVVLAANDYRVLQPRLVTDPNGNQTEVAFDALGMVVATAVMGKPGARDGDTIGDPTTRIEYDLLAWQNRQTPVFVHTFAREQHGGANTRFQEAFSYSDGSGPEVLRKVQAEPDPATGQARWIGTGRTVFDNKGNPVKKYEPYFAADSGYEDEPSIVQQGVTSILRYDPLGRLVRTDMPDGTFATVAFDPWGETHADANDNVLESAWYQSHSAATAGAPVQRAARLAAAHAHTPAVRLSDPLGRAFLSIEDNGPAGKYATRSALDIQGNALLITDARGNIALRQTVSLEKHPLHTFSADAGDRFIVPDVGGTSPRSFDGRGFALRTVYDRLRRPSHVYVTPPAAPPTASAEILVERIVYGEAASGGGAADNLRGRKVLHYDGAGELSQTRYDFKGNLTTATRRLAVTFQTTPDWTDLAEVAALADVQARAAPLLEPETPLVTTTFTTVTAFDALNRPTRITTPDLSVVVPLYDEANRLDQLKVNLRGAPLATPFVTNIDYNARGQRIRVDHGNGTSTLYSYDPLTFLLARQTTTRAVDGGKLQDFAPTYDPVHNIVAIDDEADASLFFRGSVPVAGGGAYEYDAIYRLTSATGREHPGQQMPDETDSPFAALPHPNDTQAMRAYVESYQYDEAGNIKQMLHQQFLPQGGTGGWKRRYDYVPGSDRLLATSAPGDVDGGPLHAPYEHDANGNMTRMPHLPAMTWDHANRLQSATLGDGTSFYTYDAGGMRVRKIVQRSSGALQERIYVGGGYEVFRDRTAASVDQERVTLHVLDGAHRIALVETKTVDAGAQVTLPTSRMRYQLNGHLNSSLVELSEQAGLITYEEYFQFGATSFHSADGGLDISAKRFRYIGKERDDESGLNSHGARYYASWLGRWTAADPAGTIDGPNLYCYARNNPMTFVDPSGHVSVKSIVHDVKEAAKTVLEVSRLLIGLAGSERLPQDAEVDDAATEPENVVDQAKKGGENVPPREPPVGGPPPPKHLPKAPTRPKRPVSPGDAAKQKDKNWKTATNDLSSLAKKEAQWTEAQDSLHDVIRDTILAQKRQALEGADAARRLRFFGPPAPAATFMKVRAATAQQEAMVTQTGLLEATAGVSGTVGYLFVGGVAGSAVLGGGTLGTATAAVSGIGTEALAAGGGEAGAAAAATDTAAPAARLLIRVPTFLRVAAPAAAATLEANYDQEALEYEAAQQEAFVEQALTRALRFARQLDK
jgi:RHS repeat-associated protein